MSSTADLWLPSSWELDKIKPVSGNVLIVPKEREAVSKFLVDPKLHEHEACQGTIIALADDVGEDIVLGADVIFAPYSHRSLDLHGNMLFVVHWSDVLARVGVESR